MIRLGTLIEFKFLNSSFSNSNISIRAFRIYYLMEFWQSAPCRAIRGNSISVSSTLPPLKNGGWLRSLAEAPPRETFVRLCGKTQLRLLKVESFGHLIHSRKPAPASFYTHRAVPLSPSPHGCLPSLARNQYVGWSNTHVDNLQFITSLETCNKHKTSTRFE